MARISFPHLDAFVARAEPIAGGREFVLCP